MYAELSNQIIFYYPVLSVVDRLKMYSQYPARTFISKEENSSEEQYITDDDLLLIYAESETAISRIFQVAVKLSRGITDALLKNCSLAIGSTTIGLVYGFRLNNYHGYNPNVLPVLDANIQAYWTNLIMQSWFAITKNEALYKVESSKQLILHVAYNNSLTELYKPGISTSSVLPEYTHTEIVIDDETGEPVTDTITITLTDSIVTDMQEVFYYDSYSLFPEVGVADIIYVDRSGETMYKWTGTSYDAYNSPNRTFSISFYDVNTVVCQHNLGKYMPNVKMTDADGQDWEVDYEADTVNQGIVSWNKNKTGTLYLD